jgi:hypothetical protein
MPPEAHFHCISPVYLAPGDKLRRQQKVVGGTAYGAAGACFGLLHSFWDIWPRWGCVGCCWVLLVVASWCWRVPHVHFRFVSGGPRQHLAWIGSGARLLFAAPPWVSNFSGWPPGWARQIGVFTGWAQRFSGSPPIPNCF